MSRVRRIVKIASGFGVIIAGGTSYALYSKMFVDRHAMVSSGHIFSLVNCLVDFISNFTSLEN